MRLTQLQYFMAVYEHQNITKAAEKTAHIPARHHHCLKGAGK